MLIVACVPQVPSEKIDAQLHNLSDQELDKLINETGKETNGLVGKAYAVGGIQAPTQQVHQQALLEKNKRVQVADSNIPLPNSDKVAMANPKFSKLKNLPLNWWDAESISGTIAKDLMNKKDGQMKGNMLIDLKGKVGHAFSFDGVDDYLEMSHFNNDVPLVGMTADAWIKPAGFESFISQVILVQEGSLTWRLKLSPENIVGGASLYFMFNDGVSSYGFKTLPLVSVEKWNHLAVTFQHGFGSDPSKVKLYVNGVEAPIAKSGALTPELWSPGINLWLGKSAANDPFTKPFNGLIDEVRIFNLILTPLEIKQLYDNYSS